MTTEQHNKWQDRALMVVCTVGFIVFLIVEQNLWTY